MRVKFLAKYVLHRLEGNRDSCLPYGLSKKKHDEFFAAIRALTGKDEVKTALIIGATPGEGPTEALLAGAKENNNRPSVFCVRASRQQAVSSERRFPKDCVVKCYRLGGSVWELESTIKGIKEENRTNFFDVVLIDGSELPDEWEVRAIVSKQLYGSRFIMLDDVNRAYSQRNYEVLARDPNYVVVDCNFGLRHGYAIFEGHGSMGGKGMSAACSVCAVTE